MKTSLKFAATVAIVLALAGCESGGNGPGTKETFGTLGGAALGGLLGAQVGSGSGKLAATAIGVLLGGYAGNSLGKSLDRADKAYASKAQQQAYQAPMQQSVAWSNPKSGNSGSITPVREGKNTSTGEYCREYETTINVGGKSEKAVGRACRQPDGTWLIIQ
jgi:surface antigen